MQERSVEAAGGERVSLSSQAGWGMPRAGHRHWASLPAEGEGGSSSLDKELRDPGSGVYPQDVPIAPGPGGKMGAEGGRGGAAELCGKNRMNEPQTALGSNPC